MLELLITHPRVKLRDILIFATIEVTVEDAYELFMTLKEVVDLISYLWNELSAILLSLKEIATRN